VLLAQRRLREVHRSPAVKQLLASRTYFEDALRWMEIHGGPEGQELAAYWRSLDMGDVPPPVVAVPKGGPPEDEPPRRRPGRRRRRRRRPRPSAAPQA
jgi:hypothetical protein